MGFKGKNKSACAFACLREGNFTLGVKLSQKQNNGPLSLHLKIRFFVK
jgi:hypothetical protein